MYPAVKGTKSKRDPSSYLNHFRGIYIYIYISDINETVVSFFFFFLLSFVISSLIILYNRARLIFNRVYLHRGA